MTKLLFSGCSFVAGDAIVWDKYFPDIRWEQAINREPNTHKVYSQSEIQEKYLHYVKFIRPLHSLAAQVNTLRGGGPFVDLATDGASNDSIAHSVISYLLNFLA